MSHFNLGDRYPEIEHYNKAIHEFEEALDLFKKWDTYPPWQSYYAELGIAYQKTGRYKKEKKLYKQTRKDFSNSPGMFDQFAYLALTEKDTVEANQYIEKWISAYKEQSWSDAQIAHYLSYIYDMAGIPDKKEEYLRKALSLDPENPKRMHNLAYFLFDSGRNLKEGIEIADKAVKLASNNTFSNLAKGWGLYKQGKYNEALQSLEKADSLKVTYNHRLYLNLEAARKTVAGKKNKIKKLLILFLCKG
jgi:tetratricopeptide (TPR) repeat protein